MKRPKISLIGAGQIGGVQAQLIAQRRIGDVVLYDVVEGVPQGKALDICHALSGWGSDVRVTGTNDYKDTAGSDLYVVTADGKVWGRPVGVTVASDGALLVTDDGSNSIWRVSYVAK